MASSLLDPYLEHSLHSGQVLRGVVKEGVGDLGLGLWPVQVDRRPTNGQSVIVHQALGRHVSLPADFLHSKLGHLSEQSFFRKRRQESSQASLLNCFIGRLLVWKPDKEKLTDTDEGIFLKTKTILKTNMIASIKDDHLT